MCRWGCKNLSEFAYEIIRVRAFLCVSEDFLTTESVSFMVIRLYTDCFSTWNIFDKFSISFRFQIHPHEIVPCFIFQNSTACIVTMLFIIYWSLISFLYGHLCQNFVYFISLFFSKFNFHFTDPFYHGFVWLVSGSLFLILFMWSFFLLSTDSFIFVPSSFLYDFNRKPFFSNISLGH